MTRKKVKLAFITNDSARKATYKKRKKGLLKKASELSTLCGIDACAIIYSPYEAQPEVWPASPVAVQKVLSKFKKMPEMEQSKKMVDQETFLKQRILKLREQLRRQMRENREKQITQMMFRCLIGESLAGFNILELNDLCWLIDQYMKDIQNRCEVLRRADNSNSNPSPELKMQEYGGGRGLHLGMANNPAIVASAMEPQREFLELINNQGLNGPRIGYGGQEELAMMHGFVDNRSWSNAPSQLPWEK